MRTAAVNGSACSSHTRLSRSSALTSSPSARISSVSRPNSLRVKAIAPATLRSLSESVGEPATEWWLGWADTQEAEAS